MKNQKQRIQMKTLSKVLIVFSTALLLCGCSILGGSSNDLQKSPCAVDYSYGDHNRNNWKTAE